METIRKYIQSLLFERKLSCAEWVYDKHFDSLDLATKNYLRKLIKSKEILDEIKNLFPVNIPSSNGDSEESAESDDDVDEENKTDCRVGITWFIRMHCLIRYVLSASRQVVIAMTHSLKKEKRTIQSKRGNAGKGQLTLGKVRARCTDSDYWHYQNKSS